MRIRRKNLGKYQFQLSVFALKYMAVIVLQVLQALTVINSWFKFKNFCENVYKNLQMCHSSSFYESFLGYEDDKVEIHGE